MPGRILIVDDLAASVKVLAAKLTSEFYDVLTAHDGPAALDAVSRDCPDLVLLDVMMPGMDGFEVCEKIKQTAKTAHIPVVMVTALNDVRDRVRGMRAGADDFLSKPVNDTMLFARVNSLIRMKRTVDQWILHRETSRELGVDIDTVLTGDDGRRAAIAVFDSSDIHGANIRDILMHQDHRVDLVSNYEDTQGKIFTSKPDVVIISLDYDSDNALSLASRIRNTTEFRDIPILLIGDGDDESGLIKGLDLGIDDCISRPVDDQEIVARVRTQVRRRRYQERFRQSWGVGGPTPVIDPATGLHSHRYFTLHLGRMIDDAVKSDTPLSVVLIGLDRVQPTTDNRTSVMTDAMLKLLAGRILSNVRGFDLVARYGSEMFMVAMPDTDAHVARSVVERLRTRIAGQPFTDTHSATAGDVDLILKAGIETAASNGEDAAALIARAEAAFEIAK